MVFRIYVDARTGRIGLEKIEANEKACLTDDFSEGYNAGAINIQSS